VSAAYDILVERAAIALYPEAWTMEHPAGVPRATRHRHQDVARELARTALDAAGVRELLEELAGAKASAHTARWIE
jgi:hypothetical protein